MAGIIDVAANGGLHRTRHAIITLRREFGNAGANKTMVYIKEKNQTNLNVVNNINCRNP